MSAEEKLQRNCIEYEDAIDEKEFSAKELFSYLLGKFKIIFGVAMICAVITAVLVFLVISPTFKATCKLYIVSGQNSVVDLSALQLSNSMAADYQEMFQNHVVHDQVKEALELDYEYEQLEKMVKVSNPSGTHILYISASSKDREEATNLANTYATVVRQFIKEKMDSRMPSVFEEAQIPDKKDSPRRGLDTILGFMLGGLIACSVYVFKFLTNDGISTVKRVENEIGLPVLGMMPLDKNKGKTAKR